MGLPRLHNHRAHGPQLTCNKNHLTPISHRHHKLTIYKRLHVSLDWSGDVPMIAIDRACLGMGWYQKDGIKAGHLGQQIIRSPRKVSWAGHQKPAKGLLGILRRMSTRSDVQAVNCSEVCETITARYQLYRQPVGRTLLHHLQVSTTPPLKV